MVQCHACNTRNTESKCAAEGPDQADTLIPYTLSPAPSGFFCEPQIDHFVMAITSVEAIVWYPDAVARPWATAYAVELN
jgi:hypothetical protein